MPASGADVDAGDGVMRIGRTAAVWMGLRPCAGREGSISFSHAPRVSGDEEWKGVRTPMRVGFVWLWLGRNGNGVLLSISHTHSTSVALSPLAPVVLSSTTCSAACLFWTKIALLMNSVFSRQEIRNPYSFHILIAFISSIYESLGHDDFLLNLV